MTPAGGIGLTRGAIWLALTLYVASEVVRARGHGPARATLARRLSALGFAAFLGHVAGAFHFYHHWSHAAAYADTARQTGALFGWNWGGGLYVNYGFAFVWLAELLRDRTAPAPRRWRTGLVRAFFLLMLFSGGVLFVRGGAAVYGALLCGVLLWCWGRRSGP